MCSQIIVAFINIRKLILPEQIYKPHLLNSEIQMFTILMLGNLRGTDK
jgi:hypothetical protein